MPRLNRSRVLGNLDAVEEFAGCRSNGRRERSGTLSQAGLNSSGNKGFLRRDCTKIHAKSKEQTTHSSIR